MNAQPQPIRTVDQLVQDLLDVQEQSAQLADRASSLKAQIAEQLGVGGEAQVGDVKVTVREPNRRFNVQAAAKMLTAEQVALATTETLDPSKVKQFLPPVLLEQCMDAGTGAPIVAVK